MRLLHTNPQIYVRSQIVQISKDCDLSLFFKRLLDWLPDIAEISSPSSSSPSPSATKKPNFSNNFWARKFKRCVEGKIHNSVRVGGRGMSEVNF